MFQEISELCIQISSTKDVTEHRGAWKGQGRHADPSLTVDSCVQQSTLYKRKNIVQGSEKTAYKQEM